MTRVIKSRRGVEGSDYHACPKLDKNIAMQDCTGCIYRSWVEELPSTYRVHCDFMSGSDIKLFEPAKAHSTIKGLNGINVVQSPDHTWVEEKLDGVRALVHCTPTGVYITTRRLNKQGEYKQFQDNVPHLRDSSFLRSLGKRGYTILDGEVIAPHDTDTLANTMKVVGSGPDVAIARQLATGKLGLHLFDAPWINGDDMTNMPLYTRHYALEMLFEDYKHDKSDVYLVDNLGGMSPSEKLEEYAEAIERGSEGLIIKNPGATYYERGWLKVKGKITLDAQVTGWEHGSAGGKWEHHLGALIVSVFNHSGVLVDVAKVIPGDDEMREGLYQQLESLADPVIEDLNMIVEMEAQIWTKDYRLRHPRIVKWRPDKSSPNKVDFSTVTVA
jgi:ATP-dependent DNA ligase